VPLFSRARITLQRAGRVSLEGAIERYRGRLAPFFAELGCERGRIIHRFGQWRFSRHFDPDMRQRILNFLVNECPLRE